MTDFNERIDMLEKTIDELRIDLYASKVAINVLSTVISNISGEPDLLEKSYEQTRSSAPLVKFNHPVAGGDEEIITENVFNLLAITEHNA